MPSYSHIAHARARALLPAYACATPPSRRGGGWAACSPLARAGRAGGGIGLCRWLVPVAGVVAGAVAGAQGLASGDRLSAASCMDSSTELSRVLHHRPEWRAVGAVGDAEAGAGGGAHVVDADTLCDLNQFQLRGGLPVVGGGDLG